MVLCRSPDICIDTHFPPTLTTGEQTSDTRQPAIVGDVLFNGGRNIKWSPVELIDVLDTKLVAETNTNEDLP